MNKQIRFILLFLVLSSLILSVSAQEDLNKKKGKLEMGIGFNFLGPIRQMDKLMIERQFDATTDNWIFGGTTKHPHSDAIGFSAYISYSQAVNKNSFTGIRISYSGLREIDGATLSQEYLFVRFSNISIIPFFAYELSKSFELESGPALMINTGNRINISMVKTENYTKVSPGLLAGIKLKIWNRRISYGKLGAQYLLSYKNKMGPYTTKSLFNTAVLPESNFNFSHMNIIFSIGLHLK